MTTSVQQNPEYDNSLFPETFPLPHAIEWGEDDYGLYQVFNFFGVEHGFRWIPPGRFLMGSPEYEKDRGKYEVQHWVTLTKGFWLAETTVTQALWQAVMGDNPSEFKAEQNPVERVSWKDAQKFIEKIKTALPELLLKLPTEAQWEYACRAGTQTPFWFESELSLKDANYWGKWDSGDDENSDNLGKTCEVKRFKPNPWGLYQMHGNVWEWCEDYWNEDLGREPAVDPTGPKDGALRVVRGGGWFGIGRDLRSATRKWDDPVIRLNDLGLRLSLGHELQGGGADT
ncbi:formylglycine-generating enzyme family protein [Sessilibacter corallicola]|uniref:Sulfatase-modifying factor enzyme-like domain-containing protein n=1 Tax=Sessilibacter corallicola TaxID=2904075 RepID=A0ABQ0ADH0_9GAMM